MYALVHISLTPEKKQRARDRLFMSLFVIEFFLYPKGMSDRVNISNDICAEKLALPLNG